MRIECPECKLNGNIDDSTVPATGLAMSCPRCKKRFTVERALSQGDAAVAMLDACPKCQYATFSEEKFSVCPKCGLVVAEYQKALRTSGTARIKRPVIPSAGQSVQPDRPPRLTAEQMRKEEESRKKHGLDMIAVEAELTEAVTSPLRLTADAPLPVLVAGGAVVAVSVIFFIFGVSGMVEYGTKTAEAKAAAESFEAVQSEGAIFMQFLLFPMLSVLLSLLLFVSGGGFLKLKRWSIKVLEMTAWGAIAFIVLMKVNDIVFWFKRASSEASAGYYAMGLLGDLMQMVFYIVPFVVLLEFFKSSLFEKSEDLFL